MQVYLLRLFSALLAGVFLFAACANNGDNSAKTISAQANSNKAADAPVIASPPQTISHTEQTAFFAGGCFWGVEAVFEHTRGVSDVTSGFSVGKANSAGNSDHAESVKVTYNPSKITYQQLLKVFFLIAHDPTEINRQGPDIGTEYRSVIFYETDEQKNLAEKYIAELSLSKTFPRPIATEIVPLDSFKPAGEEHQDYMVKHPDDSYIVVNDKPKLENFGERMPDLYVAK